MDQFAFSGFSASNMLACVVDGTDIRSRWGSSSSWLTSASGCGMYIPTPGRRRGRPHTISGSSS